MTSYSILSPIRPGYLCSWYASNRWDHPPGNSHDFSQCPPKSLHLSYLEKAIRASIGIIFGNLFAIYTIFRLFVSRFLSFLFVFGKISLLPLTTF